MMFRFLAWVTGAIFRDGGVEKVVQIWGNFNNFGFTIIKCDIASGFSSIHIKARDMYL